MNLTPDTNLEDIDDLLIAELLLMDLSEGLYFDFKYGIEGNSDHEKHAIRKAIASFANTLGGFLFLGIHDKRTSAELSGLGRVVGIPTTDELGKRVTQKYLQPHVCSPTLLIEQATVVLIDGKSIGVVKIPQSSGRPHGVRFLPDRPLEFWARSAETAVPMDYGYLVSEMDRSREFRGWLAALKADLDAVIRKADEMSNKSTADPQDDFPAAFNSIVTSNLGDLLRMFAVEREVAEKLISLKDSLLTADACWDHMHSLALQRPPYSPFPEQRTQAWIDQLRIRRSNIALPAGNVSFHARNLKSYLDQTYATS